MKGFKYATGLMGATEPGQRVTAKNAHLLPPGSVVRNGDASRLIHLHDGIWLWCCDGGHCYGRLEDLAYRLDKDSVACHVAPDPRHYRSGTGMSNGPDKKALSSGLRPDAHVERYLPTYGDRRVDFKELAWAVGDARGDHHEPTSGHDMTGINMNSLARIVGYFVTKLAPHVEPRGAWEALESAVSALRSYQYGNSATDLAEEVADKCEAALRARPAAPEGQTEKLP